MRMIASESDCDSLADLALCLSQRVVRIAESGRQTQRKKTWACL